MRFTELFTKTRKETPKDELSNNAKLLIRAGFIHKEMAGVYSYLPLGLRVLNNICQIIREEMNAIGGQEVFLTTLQDPEVWKETGRWDDTVVDNWFKTKLKNETELGMAFTHEEALTRIMHEHIESYKDLPKYVYQLQTKFRNELRAKSGLMRGREFLMKDLYSFTATEKELDSFYEMAKDAYMKIFTRCGIGEMTFVTFASGGVFSKFSHEFQTLSEAGEDTIYVSNKKKMAVNREIMADDILRDLGLERDELVEQKAIEVGNIFKLGTRFSSTLGLLYTDENGQRQPVIMGSYGIGPGRLMGTIVELFNDERGILWPEAMAPFKVHLIVLEGGEEQGEQLYRNLMGRDIEVLYDDRRDKSAGEKFADADLIGIPLRLIVSKKTVEKESAEVKKRAENGMHLEKLTSILNMIK